MYEFPGRRYIRVYHTTDKKKKVILMCKSVEVGLRKDEHEREFTCTNIFFQPDDVKVAHLKVAALAVLGHIAQVVVVIQKSFPCRRGLLQDVGDLFRTALLLHDLDRKRKCARVQLRKLRLQNCACGLAL